MHNRVGWRLGIVTAAILVASHRSVSAEPAVSPTPEQIHFFESKIRPILVENCQRCHGEKKQNGSLRLDSGAAVLAGGESGPAIVPGEPEKSRLIEAINYGSLEMPPDARLKPEQVALLTEWVKMGAPWPGGGDVALQPRKGSLVVTDADRQHWAFQPVRRPSVPIGTASGGHDAPGNLNYREADASRSPRNSIDTFIVATLAEHGLQLSSEAEKRHLVRRLSFDLTGLPPTFDEAQAFERDERPDAYERLVDRLLASPQYGERWARHWLDVVRFAQSNGYERDSEKPLAWRYRDYVIRAFNEDKPYDRFLIEQLAGDELTPLTDDSITATAYYRLGVWDDEPDDGKQARADELDDIVSTTASAMLGLTLGCARCHDHKFDPIGQEDYSSFTAFMQNIHLYGKMADTISGGQPVDKEGVFRALPSGGGETLCVRERETPPPESFVFIRGNAHTPGKAVTPRFIEVLCKSAEAAKWEGEAPAKPASDHRAQDELRPPVPTTRGRRTALAQWIASRDNPLTARVAVNRLWQHHFGRGIVATPSDFGHTGIKPTHPELLDYLATELVDSNWQVKRMQRRIVESATYRQSSRILDFGFSILDSKENAVLSANSKSKIQNPKSVDPDNRLLWRQNLRRLEAEAIRDAVLAASGELNLQMGGRGFFPALPPEVLAKQSKPGNGWDKSPADQQARRSVYIFVKRTLGVPLLESFDTASPDIPTAQRSVTTIAPQALILLNSDFINQQAAAMAAQLKAAACCDPIGRIDDAYKRALAREPTDHEASVALNFLQRWNDQDDQTLAELCKLILNLNEFVYID
jgi:hypothetical protein